MPHQTGPIIIILGCPFFAVVYRVARPADLLDCLDVMHHIGLQLVVRGVVPEVESDLCCCILRQYFNQLISPAFVTDGNAAIFNEVAVIAFPFFNGPHNICKLASTFLVLRDMQI